MFSRSGGISREIDLDNNHDDMSYTTETEIITALTQQEEYYESNESEVTKKDTEKTLQTYIKKIF